MLGKLYALKFSAPASKGLPTLLSQFTFDVHEIDIKRVHSGMCILCALDPICCGRWIEPIQSKNAGVELFTWAWVE